jgi:hypothetical protein
VRGRTTLALGAGIVLLAFLLLAEVRGHARTTERLAAEYVERSTAASPDRLGRFNLSAWREATADEGVGAGSSDWPAWWGSSDAVGRSPFDHVPSRGRRRRVLFLTSYTDYLERMNTHTYELVDGELSVARNTSWKRWALLRMAEMGLADLSGHAAP